ELDDIPCRAARLLAHDAAIVAVKGLETFHERVFRQAASIGLWRREVEQTKGLAVLDHRILEGTVVDHARCRIALDFTALHRSLKRAVPAEAGHELVVDAK